MFSEHKGHKLETKKFSKSKMPEVSKTVRNYNTL